MQCNELTHDLLIDYEQHDASMRERIRLEIASHLDTCERCKTRAKQLLQLAALVKAQAGPAKMAVPASIDEAVIADFKEQAAAVRRSPTMRRTIDRNKPLLLPWMAAAALLVICLGLFTLLWAPFSHSSNTAEHAPTKREMAPHQTPQLPVLRDDILPSWSVISDEPSRTAPHIISAPAENRKLLRGDLNGDGSINSIDVLLCTSPTLFNVPSELADINRDGIVDIVDTLLVARAAQNAANEANAPTAVISDAGRGDLNGDGRVDCIDSRLLSSMLADPGIALPRSADLNNDGIVDIIDALLMARNPGNETK